MASITNVALDIVPDETARMADVRVSCEVNFSGEELAVMNEKPELVYFQLDCSLMGQDAGKFAAGKMDDWLHAFATKNFPDETPTAVEKVKFEARLGYGLLNEDVLGIDEIYARLMLRGRFRFESVTEAKSDLYHYDFGRM